MSEDAASGTGTGAVAVFDFDGTITRRDTLVAFVVGLAGVWRVLCVLGGQWRLLLRYVAHRAGRDEFKEAMLRSCLTGVDLARAEAAAERYAARVVASRLRPDALDRIAWHQARGHRLVIVSASLDLYLRHIGPTLGFDDVIGVELRVDAGGCLTGEMCGPNVRGPEKVVRLDALLGGPPAESWAYGDSSGDDELLAWADHAYRV